MSIYDINKITLMSLYGMFPNSFDGLSLNNQYLVFRDQKVDISTFNINNLLDGQSLFGSFLGNLKPENVFDIIRIHANFMGMDDQNKTNYSYSDFLSIVNDNQPVDDASKNKLTDYLQEFQLMELYDDYLLPTLNDVLRQYQYDVDNWAMGNDSNSRKQFFINMVASERRKSNAGRSKDNVKTLSLRNGNQTVFYSDEEEEDIRRDQFGFSSVLQIIILTGLAIAILIGVTLMTF